MINLSNPWHKMFIQADGKNFQVRALCHSSDEANQLCAADKTLSVIDVDEATGTTILADKEPFETQPHDELLTAARKYVNHNVEGLDADTALVALEDDFNTLKEAVAKL